MSEADVRGSAAKDLEIGSGFQMLYYRFPELQLEGI